MCFMALQVQISAAPAPAPSASNVTNSTLDADTAVEVSLPQRPFTPQQMQS